jgi:hypothetical protein
MTAAILVDEFQRDGKLVVEIEGANGADVDTLWSN